MRKAISNQRMESGWLVKKLVRKGETPGKKKKDRHHLKHKQKQSKYVITQSKYGKNFVKIS